MDSTLRNTPALLSKIDKLRDDLIKRYENLIGLAVVEKKDRTTTAVVQYQMQVETAALIRAAEDVQTLIRQLQEMWLFGQLDTLSDGKLEQQTGDNAKAIAGLLQQLMDRQQTQPASSNGDTAMTNGS